MWVGQIQNNIGMKIVLRWRNVGIVQLVLPAFFSNCVLHKHFIIAATGSRFSLSRKYQNRVESQLLTTCFRFCRTNLIRVRTETVTYHILSQKCEKCQILSFFSQNFRGSTAWKIRLTTDLNEGVHRNKHLIFKLSYTLFLFNWFN